MHGATPRHSQVCDPRPPIADVMSFIVALESTAQWETSRARAWAYMKALARPDSACAPEASHAAVSQAHTIDTGASIPDDGRRKLKARSRPKMIEMLVWR
jgi:hypothetical protein